MPFDDPNAPPDPNAEPEPKPEATPEPPSIPLDAAIDAVAQHYGWDPRVTDYELREMRQRKEALDRKEREVEAREERIKATDAYVPPQGYENDPAMKMLSSIQARLDRQDEEKRQERERETRLARLSQDLDSNYESLMARVPNKVDRAAFFRAMQEVYPEQELLERVGVDRAAQIVYRYMQANPLTGNANQPQYRPSRRDPIVIPGASTGGQGPPAGFDEARPPQRNPNEPEADYARRYEAWRLSLPPGFGGLKDGQKVRAEW